jgi:adenosylmethionine-8-amino-7-oxononanoate aminotransferase
MGARVGKELVKRGLYTRILGDTILLAPPLVTPTATVDRIVQILGESIAAVS